MIARLRCPNLAKATPFFRVAPMQLPVAVHLSAEMTVPLLGVITTLDVMIVATGLMNVMAIIVVMTDMVVAVVTAAMIEMATIGEMIDSIVMTDSIVIAMMIEGTIGVVTEMCSVVMEVAVAVDGYLLALSILPARFAQNMGTLHVTVGGAILTVMMRMKTALAMRRVHMEWTPIGIWTLAPRTTSQEN
jgi:hypothetical protein